SRLTSGEGMPIWRKNLSLTLSWKCGPVGTRSGSTSGCRFISRIRGAILGRLGRAPTMFMILKRLAIGAFDELDGQGSIASGVWRFGGREAPFARKKH